MRPLTLCLVALGLSVVASAAQETTNAPAPLAAPAATADETARYTALRRREMELSTRVKLFSDLGAEHRSKAEAARGRNEAGLERWESDLAKDLSDRAARELAELNAVSRERAGMEEARQLVAADPLDAERLSKNSALTADEAAFYGKLRERTWELEQEIAATLEAGKNAALQLQTNNLPHEVGRISLELENNAMQVRVLQKQLTDLELMKLQFRALRGLR